MGEAADDYTEQGIDYLAAHLAGECEGPCSYCEEEATMPSMIDARCEQCGKRFGSSGRMADRPPCPRCGHRPSQAELEAADAEMEAMEQRLRTHPQGATADVRRQQRIDAGLTLHQAAKLLHMPAMLLADLEAGRREPTPEQAALMAEVYGVGEGG